MAAPELHREKVVDISWISRGYLVDIMAALKASLSAVKKPLGSATSARSSDEAKPAKRRARG